MEKNLDVQGIKYFEVDLSNSKCGNSSEIAENLKHFPKFKIILVLDPNEEEDDEEKLFQLQDTFQEFELPKIQFTVRYQEKEDRKIAWTAKSNLLKFTKM